MTEFLHLIGRKMVVLKNNQIYRTLDKLWEYIIKDRAGWRCEICHSEKDGLEAHHINGRGDLWTRWDKRNGIAVCRVGCHDKTKVKAWLKENDPARHGWLERQKAKLHQGLKIDLEAIERRLRSQI